MSRYVVGIDLGTTNSALAYAEAERRSEADPPIRPLPIPQVVAAGEVADRAILPSFLYLPAAKEFPPAALDVPWSKGGERVIGHLRPRPRGQGPGPAGGFGQELAVARRDRPQEPRPPLGSPRRLGQGLARRGLDRLPRPPPRRLEQGDGGEAGRPPGEARRLADRPRLVRRRGPGPDRRGRPGRRPGERDLAGGAPGRLLCLARLARGRLAEAGQGGRPPAGLRRRRRHDRLHPDRRDRPGGGPRADPPRRRRAHPARRRQHGPRPGPCRGRHLAQRHGRPRPRPADRARPRLPACQGDVVRGPEQGKRPGVDPRPGVEGDRRLAQGRADPRDAQRGPPGWILPPLRPDRRPDPRPYGPASSKSACPTPATRPSPATWPGSSAARPARSTPRGPSSSPRRSSSTAAFSRPASSGTGSSKSSPPGPASRSRAWRRPTSISPSRWAPRITGWSARGRGSGSEAGSPGAYYVGIETSAPAVPGVKPPIKALCVLKLGTEEGTEAAVPGPGVRPGRRRARRVPLPRLDHPPRRRPRGDARPLVTRRPPGARPARNRPRGRRRRDRRRHRPRPPPRPRHRGRDPRTLVPKHPRRPPLEARIQRPRRPGRLIDAPPRPAGSIHPCRSKIT